MLSNPLYSNVFPENTFYKRSDIFSSYKKISNEFILKRESALKFLLRDAWESIFSLFSQLPQVNQSGFEVKDGVLVTKEIFQDNEKLSLLLEKLIPWRKGPWCISGNLIDAEWRSNIKYDLISEIIRDNKSSTLIDIGSGNGYYGFRALDDGASKVLCIDPSEKFFFQFELFQYFAQNPSIQYELLSFQDTKILPIKFDIALCMGIVYHQKNAYEVLECARESLKPGGLLVLESMTYPSNESIAFIPDGRYAKARNVYHVHSSRALMSLCKNVGFNNVEIFNERASSIDEQRKTGFAPYESLEDFLDKNDRSKTIEGYLSPNRAIILARKKK